MTYKIVEVTCDADPKKPRMVRVAATLNAPLPASHMLWSEIRSNGKRSPGEMKPRAGAYRRSPLAMPDDPVTVKLSVVARTDPHTAIAEFEQDFDLGRGGG